MMLSTQTYPSGHGGIQTSVFVPEHSDCAETGIAIAEIEIADRTIRLASFLFMVCPLQDSNLCASAYETAYLPLI